MARCKGCIHDNVCNRDVGHGYSICPHYISADVVPKSEADKWVCKCRDWHEVAELKSQFIVELEAELSEAKSKVAREIFAEIEFDIHQLMFERDETRAIAIEGVIANLKKKYTEGE